MPELASTRSDEKTTDVSVRMAQALRNLQCAVSQSSDAIFFTDQAGIISRVNPAFEELTGYSAIHALGKDLSAFVARGPHSDEYREIWA